MTVNINSAKALNSVVGHEITHVLEGTGEFYTALESMVTEYAKSKGEYNARLTELRSLYADVDGYKGADGHEKIKKELVADLVGDYIFTDSEFINRLSVENRDIFDKIYDELKYLCRVATAGSKEARQLEKAKKAFEDAYRVEGTLPDEVRYSITAEMTDLERHDDLKNKKLAVITETATTEYTDEISSLEELKKKAKSKAEDIIYPLAKNWALQKSSYLMRI